MANYSISIPGHDDVNLDVGDTLTITFTSAAKFCVESGNPDCFDPCLPVDQPQPKGTVWPSANGGAEAICDTTISYTHCANDKDCGSGGKPTADPPGTIKVGSGK